MLLNTMPGIIPRMGKQKPGRKPASGRGRELSTNRHTKPRKAFHADQSLFDQLDRYLESARPQPSESECLRIALEEFLEKRGFWPPKPAGK